MFLRGEHAQSTLKVGNKSLTSFEILGFEENREDLDQLEVVQPLEVESRLSLDYQKQCFKI